MNMMRIFYIGLSGVGMMFSSMASGNDAGGLQSPASGKYELRVLQTRNDARKNKTKKYNVDIQIK
ncbi:hypothetical protein ACSLO9_34840, partial [Escherichia coli]